MKNRIKKWICLLLVVGSVVLIDTPAAYAQGLVHTNTSFSMPGISTYKNMTKWFYTVIDGVLYRRLYDCTRNTWLTDWERVG